MNVVIFFHASDAEILSRDQSVEVKWDSRYCVPDSGWRVATLPAAGLRGRRRKPCVFKSNPTAQTVFHHPTSHLYTIKV
jgi:hypothetical protein